MHIHIVIMYIHLMCCEIRSSSNKSFFVPHFFPTPAGKTKPPSVWKLYGLGSPIELRIHRYIGTYLVSIIVSNMVTATFAGKSSTCHVSFLLFVLKKHQATFQFIRPLHFSLHMQNDFTIHMTICEQDKPHISVYNCACMRTHTHTHTHTLHTHTHTYTHTHTHTHKQAHSHIHKHHNNHAYMKYYVGPESLPHQYFKFFRVKIIYPNKHFVWPIFVRQNQLFHQKDFNIVGL